MHHGMNELHVLLPMVFPLQSMVFSFCLAQPQNLSYKRASLLGSQCLSLVLAILIGPFFGSSVLPSRPFNSLVALVALVSHPVCQCRAKRNKKKTKTKTNMLNLVKWHRLAGIGVKCMIIICKVKCAKEHMDMVKHASGRHHSLFFYARNGTFNINKTNTLFMFSWVSFHMFHFRYAIVSLCIYE